MKTITLSFEELELSRTILSAFLDKKEQLYKEFLNVSPSIIDKWTDEDDLNETLDIYNQAKRETDEEIIILTRCINKLSNAAEL